MGIRLKVEEALYLDPSQGNLGFTVTADSDEEPAPATFNSVSHSFQECIVPLVQVGSNTMNNSNNNRSKQQQSTSRTVRGKQASKKDLQFHQVNYPVPRPVRRNNPRSNSSLMNSQQVGAVQRTRITRSGVSDIRKLRLSWVAGFTYVGNGTNGVANTVYFLTGSNGSRWVAKGNSATVSGMVPIASGDLDLGAPYINDIEKHFSRKVIHRMWCHVDSLQPSTANNMMAIIGFSRGPGGFPASQPASVVGTPAGNTVPNLSSMKGSFPIDSWEHKTVEITEFIAGGSGPRQNEFEIQSSPEATSLWQATNTYPTIDPDGLIPACFAVAGNCTTAGLQATNVHQITFEQEVDLLDYVGGMANVNASD